MYEPLFALISLAFGSNPFTFFILFTSISYIFSSNPFIFPLLFELVFYIYGFDLYILTLLVEILFYIYGYEPFILILFVALIFYLYGSIPFAFIFTYLSKREIIYEKGLGTVSVANAFDVGGLKAGFLTVIGESSKALIPVFVAFFYFYGTLSMALIFISASLIGTCFSLFLKGKGGMGRTILIWSLLIFTPISALILGAIWLGLYKTVKQTFYISTFTNFLIPIVIYLVERVLPLAIIPLALFSIDRSVPLTMFGLFTAVIFSIKFKRTRDAVEYYKKKDWGAFRQAEAMVMRKGYIKKVKDAKESQVGGKAAKLGYLKKKGFRIPETYVCVFKAYEDFMSGDTNVLRVLENELARLIDSDKRYAVRSSANIEDEGDYSFAGQFETYLNVQGLESVLEALLKVWQSARGARALSYLKQIGKKLKEVKMAVIVQEMVDPQFSGIVFSKNPMNGLDEVIIEIVSGLGVTLAKDGLTPDRWVCKWGEWIDKPTNEENLPLVKEVVSGTKKIAKKYGKPVELEWAYDGKNVYWLQLREITTIRNLNFYSNRIAKEVMPGIIKPLVWSINIPMVNSAWKNLFEELVGKLDIDVNKLAKAFYYRSYFNMGVIGDIFDVLGMPRETIELMMGIERVGSERPRFRPSIKTFRYLPRMIVFALKKLMFSKNMAKFLADFREKYRAFYSVNVEKLNEKEMLRYIKDLLKINEAASYINIHAQLLGRIYDSLLRGRLNKIGVDIGKVYFKDLTKRLKDLDPKYHLSILHDKYSELPPDVKRKLKGMAYKEFSKARGVSDFRKEVNKFIQRFGYLSDSNMDFSAMHWSEDPDLMLKMIIDYKKPEIDGDRVDIDALAKGAKGRFLKFFYNRAVGYREYKERVSFNYTYGYGLFRNYFLHLAEIFKEKGFIKKEDDIFYLTLDEITDMVESGEIPKEYKKSIKQRKEEMSKYKDVILPDLIYGDEPPQLMKSMRFQKRKGVAASKGYYTGIIKVVRGLRDFKKIKEGDILVVPYTDVSWTPLFSKAKAVISESGGILSHSAIVAREYNIPAVVSVAGATELKDNTKVAVDGYNGEILIIES